MDPQKAIVMVEGTMEELSQQTEVLALAGAITRVKGIKVLTIRDDEGKRAAGEILIDVKDVIEKGETLSKNTRDPFFQMSKKIKGLFDDMLGPAYAKVQEIQSRLKDYRLVEKKREEDARQKAQEKLDKAKEKAPEIADQLPEKAVVPPAETKTKTDRGTVFTKKVLRVEVTDVRALARAVGEGVVPEGVFDVKEGYIKTLIKGGMVIPGVESWEDEGMGTRR